jgi:hypothetical protein
MQVEPGNKRDRILDAALELLAKKAFRARPPGRLPKKQGVLRDDFSLLPNEEDILISLVRPRAWKNCKG